MKINSLLLLLILPALAFGQVKTEKYFYNDNYQVVDSIDAKYFVYHIYADSISGFIKKTTLDGVIVSEEECSDIEQHIVSGFSKEYYSNGQLKSCSNYLQNELRDVTTYYENGQLRRKDFYALGYFKEGKCYSETGQEIPHFDYIILPKFPGGEWALRKYLSENIKYPEKARRKGIEGQVVVKFIIDKNGNVRYESVVKSVHSLLDMEALRVIKMMGKWEPGLVEGEKAAVKFKLPISFKLK